MSDNILALDIGEKNIGVARANLIAKIPQAHATLGHENFRQKILDLINHENIGLIVVGLPRSLEGNETKQTDYTKEFVQKYLYDQNIVWQDETLSTKTAETRPKGPYGKDADAACIILEDYLRDNYGL